MAMKRTTIWLLASAVVLVSAYVGWSYYSGGCIGSCHNMKMAMICEQSCAADDADKSKAVAQSIAAVGDFTNCPISGVVFQVTSESGHVAHGDKKAYTCCGTCAEIFNASPQEYAVNIN
jgi:hypothetical protein